MSDGWCREDHGPGTPNVHRHPPLPPARPVGGDTREALREEIGRVLEANSINSVAVQGLVFRALTADLGVIADAVLALPAVRAALDAQDREERLMREPGWRHPLRTLRLILADYGMARDWTRRTGARP